MVAKHSLAEVRHLVPEPFPYRWAWETEEKRWTLVHAFHENRGGFFIRSRRSREDRQGYVLIYTTATDILSLRKHNLISSLPRITKGQINGKSKGDVIVKATAVAQVTWMVFHVAVRVVKGLAVI